MEPALRRHGPTRHIALGPIPTARRQRSDGVLSDRRRARRPVILDGARAGAGVRGARRRGWTFDECGPIAQGSCNRSVLRSVGMRHNHFRSTTDIDHRRVTSDEGCGNRFRAACPSSLRRVRDPRGFSGVVVVLGIWNLTETADNASAMHGPNVGDGLGHGVSLVAVFGAFWSNYLA